MSEKLRREDVEEILALLENSTFDELSIETDDFKLNLRRAGAPARARPFENDLPATNGANGQSASPENVPRSAPVAGLIDVAAPMLGVFYRSPKPGADPFVQVGSRVTSESIIGIIEVMKLMNSVPAGIAGEVVEVIAPDGRLVEYGQAIIRVRPD